MSKSTTHTAELHAWLSSYQRIEGLFDSSPERLASALSYSTSGPGEKSYYENEGYTYVGKATVSVKVAPPKEILQSKVKGLQAQKQAVLAKAQKEATELEGQIQKLLAITFDEVEQ